MHAQTLLLLFVGSNTGAPSVKNVVTLSQVLVLQSELEVKGPAQAHVLVCGFIVPLFAQIGLSQRGKSTVPEGPLIV